MFKPNQFLNSATLGFLCIQTQAQSNYKHVPTITSMLKVQKSHHEQINIIEDKGCNKSHPLTHLASTANEDVLFFH